MMMMRASSRSGATATVSRGVARTPTAGQQQRLSSAAVHAAAAARTASAAARRALAPPLRAFFAEGKQRFFEMLAGSYDAPAVNAFIDEQIAKNGVVVFSWTTCPFCVKAKAALSAEGAKFAAIEIDTLPDGKAIKAELAKRTGRTSVPQVWISGEFVGGCRDGPRPGMGVVPLQESGKLRPMLQAAGAL